MLFQSNVALLKGQLLAARSRVNQTRHTGISWLHALWLLLVRQRRYVAWSTATYLTFLIEIVLLQYHYDMFVGSSSLHILRTLSIFSLLPLITLYSLEIGEPKGVFQDDDERTLLERLLLAAKGLFALKLLLTALIIVIAVYTPSFTRGAPLILQAMILARVIAGPWDSTAGFLLLARHGKYLMSHEVVSRSVAILADLFGLVFLLYNYPLAYFCWHVGTRILRSQYFFKAVLSTSWLEMFRWSKSEIKNVFSLFKKIRPFFVPLFLAWAVAELGFFRLGVVLTQYDSQAGLLLLLAHSQYHLALAIAFRALRSKLCYLGNVFYAANQKSKRKEVFGLLKLAAVAAFISCPTAAAGLVPYINQAWLSPVGEVLILDWWLIFGSAAAGLAHACSGIALLTVAHIDSRKKYVSVIALAAIVMFEIFVFPTNAWHASMSSPLEIIGSGLLWDAGLHFSLTMLLLYIVITTKLRRFPSMEADLLSEFYQQMVSNQATPKHQWQALYFTWKKGIINRRQSLLKLTNSLTLPVIEISVGKNKSLCIFQDTSGNNAAQFLQVGLAALAESIEKFQTFSARNMADCIMQVDAQAFHRANDSASDCTLQVAEFLEQTILCEKGIPFDAITDTDVLLILTRYSRYIRDAGYYAPPPMAAELSQICHEMQAGKLSKIFILKKGTPGQVRKQQWLRNFQDLAAHREEAA